MRSCRRVPKNCKRSRKGSCGGVRKCRSRKGRTYSIPRLFSPQECRRGTNKGFTQRASCAPYRGHNAFQGDHASLRNHDVVTLLGKHSTKVGRWIIDIGDDPLKRRVATFVYNKLPRRVGELERVVQSTYGIHSIHVDTNYDQLVVAFTGPSNIYRYRPSGSRTTEYLDVYRRNILDVIAQDPKKIDSLFEHDTDLDVLKHLLTNNRL